MKIQFGTQKRWKRCYSSRASNIEILFSDFTSSHASNLKRNGIALSLPVLLAYLLGFVVVDNFLNSDHCSLFRNEIDFAHSQEQLIPNTTHLVIKSPETSNHSTVFIEKKGIFEIPVKLNIDLVEKVATHFKELELSSHTIKGTSSSPYQSLFLLGQLFLSKSSKLN
jgi:hypothetical protein